MLSGGVTAIGAEPATPMSWAVALSLATGTLMAVVLNGASNGLNQIYDLEVDRVNKPERPLPSGRISRGEAWAATWLMFAVALVLAWMVNIQCFTLAAAAAVFTSFYSAPPLRTKARGIWANITIAIPRGVLLKVAGWSCVKSVMAPEPWYIGLIFGLFLLGASSTKDFADIEGDRAGGCRTLPILYGVRAAAWIIAPFFVLPFLLMPLGAATGILTGNGVALSILGSGLSIWGVYVVYQVLRDPEALAKTENHPSWTHMYLMMLTAQIGFALAYLI
jgi:4-hydroxybenzoate polyprenyltransferase